MKDEKLVIKAQKYTGETAVVSMRLPKTMLATLDMIASETGKTRNEIMTLSMEYALSHMEIEKREEE